MRALVRSEWSKISSLPSVWIATTLTFALFVYCQVLALDANADFLREESAIAGVAAMSELRRNLEAYVFSAGIALPILGAVIGGAEYRAGQIGTSVMAVPDRTRLVLAKFVVTALFAVAVSAVWMSVAFAVMSISATHVESADPWTLELFAGQLRVLLVLVSFTVFPLGIALLVRSTVGCIMIAQLLIMLTITQVVAIVSPAADSFLPLSAARNLLLQGAGNPVPLTGSAAQGAMVLAIWSTLLLCASVLVVKRRDAR